MSSSRSNGFYFWSLSPFLIAFVVLMPFLVDKDNEMAIVTLVSIEMLAVLVLLGLFSPLRFWWAWRGVGAFIFLGFAAYLIAIILDGGLGAARPGPPAVTRVLKGMFVLGLPGLWFALSGRLTGRGNL